MYASSLRDVTCPADPLHVVGVLVRVIGCPIPHPGLFWVELRYNDEVVAHQPLTAEEPQ